MATLQWDNSIDAERKEARTSGSKFLKLESDGDAARIVLLSTPTRQEKQGGSSGTFVVYSVDVWNVLAAKAQTFDMAAAQVDGLIALKAQVGQDVLFSSELAVVRKGAAGDKGTKYLWTVASGITEQTRVATGGQPAVAAPAAEALPPPRTREERQLAEAETAEELKAIYTKLRDAMQDAGRDEELNALLPYYRACRKAMQA